MFFAFDKDDVLMHPSTRLNQFEFFQSFHLTGPIVMDEVDSIIEDMIRIQTELVAWAIARFVNFKLGYGATK